VDGSDDVPSTTGVKELLGLAGFTAENARIGGVVSITTVLSIEVEAAFWLLNVSVTVFTAIDGIIVPGTPTAVAESAHVILSVVVNDQVIPDALPFWTMSDVLKLSDPTAFENMIVK